MDIPPQPEKVVYYVEYTIKHGGDGSTFSNWTVTTPDGTYSNNERVKSWSETYGPVEKGFKCDVQIGRFDPGYLPNIEIRVARNDEPFILKKSVKGTTATYEIE